MRAWQNLMLLLCSAALGWKYLGSDPRAQSTKLSVHGPQEPLQKQAACWESCPLNPKASQTGSPGLSVGVGDLLLQPGPLPGHLASSAGPPGHTQIPPRAGFLGPPPTLSLGSLGSVLSVPQLCLLWQPGQEPVVLLLVSRPLSAFRVQAFSSAELPGEGLPL